MLIFYTLWVFRVINIEIFNTIEDYLDYKQY